MPVPTTALYSGILALFIVALALNVTIHRFKFHVTLGDGGNPLLGRMIRMHGNTVENVPLGLLLMGLYELDGGAAVVLHAAGITLIVARLIYVGALSRYEEKNPIRALSVILTWLTITALAILNLWQIR